MDYHHHHHHRFTSTFPRLHGSDGDYVYRLPAFTNSDFTTLVTFLHDLLWCSFSLVPKLKQVLLYNSQKLLSHKLHIVWCISMQFI